ALARARAGLLAGAEALAHAFGRDLAGADRVQPDAVARPFDRERLRHHLDAGLAHRRGHDVGRAVVDPGHDDAHDVAVGLLGRPLARLRATDPALADRLRDVERAVEDDVGDGVERARREALGRRDEVAGGVVDEAGEAAAFLP